jgi:hypothetical protein
VTLTAFDVRPTCDPADVQAILPFPPNPLKHVLCDVLNCDVDALSQFWECLWNCWDVNIVLGETPQEELPQNCYITLFPGHTNYAQSVRQPFPSNTGLRFSCEMALATIGPFQMLRSLCVIDTNFKILRHFLPK